MLTSAEAELGGQAGSRLPLTRCEIKTAWAEPTGSGGGGREKGGRKENRPDEHLLFAEFMEMEKKRRLHSN